MVVLYKFLKQADTYMYPILLPSHVFIVDVKVFEKREMSEVGAHNTRASVGCLPIDSNSGWLFGEEDTISIGSDTEAIIGRLDGFSFWNSLCYPYI